MRIYMINNRLFNSPDLYFSQWCYEQYHINRGVYNTVEQWFYTNGIEEITERRKKIVQFFSWIQHEYEQEKIKFGQGKLMMHLHLFSKQAGGIPYEKSNHT